MYSKFNKKHHQLIGLNLVFWLFMTIVVASLYYLNFGDNYEGNWWTFFWRQLPIWMFWGIISVPIFHLVHFLKQEKYSIGQQITTHFFTFCALFLCFYMFFISYNLWLSDEEVKWETIFRAEGLRFVLNYVLNLLVYLLVVIFGYAWLWQEDLQQSELEKAAIQSQLHEAKLNMLSAQIQPHFLFNALNSISGLMRKGDNPTAIRAIADLGNLLRWSLQYHPQQFIPLKSEIDFMAQYLKMEHLRFGDKLTIHLDIPIETEAILIPALILQPLVENAIKHGIYKSQIAGELLIKAKIMGDFLNIYITNDCPEIPDQIVFENGQGMGIDHIHQRLATIYSDGNYVFKITILDHQKVQAFLKLPI